uniref:Uncharacterized protein n=1 Tax=Oryza punctata TaxID=4537 RepID=A0A0E0K912_ORYPU
MRIHPSPATTAGGSCGGSSKKDLRRLPHVYSKVLELPFPADTDVAVFEGPDAFHFVVAGGATLAGAGEVRVRTVRIHPGVVRVVVQAGAAGGGVEDDDDDMELDKWRSRLPEASCPAMAVAGYVNGQLVVTVPKGRGGGEGDNDGGEEVWRCCNGGKISSRLVVVQ